MLDNLGSFYTITITPPTWFDKKKKIWKFQAQTA